MTAKTPHAKSNRLVQAIETGSVIDHITPGQAIHIVRLLGLQHRGYTLTLGLNLASKSQGHKDIIKIQHLQLSEQQRAEVAVFSPQATINVIQDYQVSAKHPLTLPQQIKGVFRCFNPNCITHIEPVQSRFAVDVLAKEVMLTCHYCQEKFNRDKAQFVD